MIRYFCLFILLAVSMAWGQSKLLTHSSRSISLEFQLPSLSQDQVTIDSRDYTVLAYHSAQTLANPGAPMMPYTITRVALPPGAMVTHQFQVAEQSEMSSIDIVPAARVNEMNEKSRVAIDEAIYQSAAPYPGKMVEISDPYTFRGMRIVDIKIYPVQYHPAQHQVRLIRRIIINLKVSNAQPGVSVSRISPTGEKLLRQRLINFEQAQNWAIPSPAGLQKITENYDFSTGNWYKIPITEEGVYRINGSFLRDQGVDIANITTGTIQMFNYGGDRLPYNVTENRPGDLNEVAIEVVDQNNDGDLDPEDVIYFYGRNIKGWNYMEGNQSWDYYLNPYSFTNYYLLTFNQNIGKRITGVNSPQLGNAVPVNQFTDRYRFQEDKYNILKSGIDWYWIKFQGTSDENTYTFNLPQNIIPSNARLTFRFKGGSGSNYWDNTSYFYWFDVIINGTLVIDNLTLANANTKSALVNTSVLRGGSNEVRIVYTGQPDGAYAFLDYFDIEIERQFIAENGFLKFYNIFTAAPAEFNVTGLPGSGNRVWDISDFANIRAINPLQNTSTVRFQAEEEFGSGKQFIVFTASASEPVGQILPVENSPNLRSTSRNAQFLIITPDEFYEAAEAWETFKEAPQHYPATIETERIKISEIYREFSSGVPDPTAIRDFIRYAHYNWNNQPEYVLLLGDGSYDYRNIELTDYTNRIPVFEISGTNEINSRVTDIFYSAIDNGTGLGTLQSEIALGRLPANSVTDVENYLQKMIRYSESFTVNERENGWQSIVTLVADDECGESTSNCNEWFHLRQSEDLFNLLPKKFNVRKIYLVDYDTQAGGLGRQKPKASADLLEQINRGTLAINFYGHGDPNTWAHEQVLNKARDLPLINNSARLPIWSAATCTWGKYDNPNSPAMSEEMIWSPEGGGIAVIAASRPTFAFANEEFVEGIFENLFHSETQHSKLLGESVLLSLSGLSGSYNEQKYHIFGDPTLRLADPEHNIRVSSISADTLKALSTVTVNAGIFDKGGRPIPGFNGKALIRVFDAVDSVTQQTNTGPFTYTYNGGTIFKGIVTVTNGQMEGNFIVPKSIKYKKSRTGRISIYAWSENLRDAVGYQNDLLFTGTESLSNTEGPGIDFSFPDQPDFFDGDYVNSQPTIVVRLSDENGINLTGEVGHRIELILDDNIKKDVTEFFVYDEDSYTEGELQYTLPAMSSGRHQLNISAWDNLNNYSEQQVSFNTTVSEELTLAQVVNYPNPFEDDTHFTFQFQSPNGRGDVRIKIYTVSGRLIQEIEDIARPGFNKIYWDGRDRDGDILANGVYLYKIVIDDGERSIEKIEKLAIVR